MDDRSRQYGRTGESRSGSGRGRGAPGRRGPRAHRVPHELPATGEELRQWCIRSDGAPYAAYKDLRRHTIALDGADLELVRVQPDPFAGPSRARLFIPWSLALFPTEMATWPGGRGALRPGLWDSTTVKAVAARDFVGRSLGRWLDRHTGGNAEGGRIGIRIEPHGQQIRDRSAALFDEDGWEIRFELSLPGRGRRIAGREALSRLVDVPEALLRDGWAALDLDGLRAHIETAEDFVFLQGQLTERNWVAFLADGAHLARRAGNDDRPLLGETVVPFSAPASAASEVELPHAGRVRGMAIPEGVTLLCGGGYHGKSTLLAAIAAAIVPHVPGDGREQVATRVDAQSIRAENGRAIHSVDLEPFIRDLPQGQSSASLSTENASGSTSQAAAILEAMASGSRLLLLDEDTSATNFMIRDPLMDELLQGYSEPIRPFHAQARTLTEGLGVSSILVVGGSGEYFRVADLVLVLDSYRPQEETVRAKEIAEGRDEIVHDPAEEDLFRKAIGTIESGEVLPVGARDPRIRVGQSRQLLIDRVPLDLPGAEALVEWSQARDLAALLSWRQRELFARLGGGRGQSARELRSCFQEEWKSLRWAGFDREIRGDLAAIRWEELLMALRRLRSSPVPKPDWGLETDSA